VALRERLDAHRLVEDFMIAANVAAAKSLERKKSPLIYRVHEPPSREKLIALKDYLATLDINFTLGQTVVPDMFNRLIERVGDDLLLLQVMEQILRTQTQAYYTPANAGHFGLALGAYAHFTSPIRRYSDLVVHRALVSAHGLEDVAPPKHIDVARSSGLEDADEKELARIAEAISATERRAMEAERDTVDRYVAAYLATHVGDIVETRITGVQPFGFFATVEGLGGDGLVPVSSLGDDYYRYDEEARALVGDNSGKRYETGQRLRLRLAEANPVSGGLRFALPSDGGGDEDGSKEKRRGRAKRPQGRRGRPANIRHQGGKRGGGKGKKR
jgi:ribonuclease R